MDGICKIQLFVINLGLERKLKTNLCIHSIIPKEKWDLDSAMINFFPMSALQFVLLCANNIFLCLPALR